MDELIINNENLIYYTLKKLGLYNIQNIDKYYDVGMLGLVKGAKTFDYNLDIKISTYLIKCIKNEILCEVRKENALKRYKSKNEVSLYTPLTEDNKVKLEDILGDDFDIEDYLIKKYDYQKLYDSINKLTDIEKYVICSYYGLYGYKEMRQRKIAKELNLSQAHISRIKNKVEKKLKGLLDGRDR